MSPEIVQGAVRNLNAMKTRISKLEMAALGEEEKTRLTGEISQFSAKLAARIKEIISRLPPRRSAGRRRGKNYKKRRAVSSNRY